MSPQSPVMLPLITVKIVNTEFMKTSHRSRRHPMLRRRRRMCQKVFLVILATAAFVASAVPSENVIRVACVGDSITAGVCASSPGGYVPILQQLLGSNYLVTNFGNSGHTMLKRGLCGPPAGGDCSYWDTDTYQQAMSSQPDVVTIFLGTNDAKTFNYFNASMGNYTKDYLDMLLGFSKLPSKPKLFAVIPCPLYPPDPFEMSPKVINTIFPSLIPRIAAAGPAGTGVIDVFNALGGVNLTQPNITCDGCHPVQQGYVEIAQTFFNALKAVATEEGWPEMGHTPTGYVRKENFMVKDMS